MFVLCKGLTQAKDFLLFVGYFFALRGEKISYLEKESTMLPQALIAFA
jgi:hypothetical protein